MILRYYNYEPFSHKEDELLFIGTEDECRQYLNKNWSIDLRHEERDTYDLRHIMFSTQILCPALFDEDTIKRIYEEGHDDWASKCEWKPINIQEYIFQDYEIIDGPGIILV